MDPSAKVIAHSAQGDNPWVPEVATLEVVMHRFVLAEFNTHRVFSRNSASSRAIPVGKQIDRVLGNPALPLVWAAEKPGMQGGEELEREGQRQARKEWLIARDAAVRSAERLKDLGLHKSIINRLLEPFMWHIVVVTSTEWENFFEQRCSPLAQPEIRATADAMREALRNSVPHVLQPGEFHKPYIDDEDRAAVAKHHNPESDLCKMSAARCCRVSREAQGGGRSFEDDMKTWERLMEPGEGPPHWSPLEHVCRAPTRDELNIMRPGNLRGWVQLRHILSGEI